jgi:TolB protein
MTGTARSTKTRAGSYGVDMDELPPDDELPVAGPGPGRRRVRVAITLLLVAAFVLVFGLEGSGFISRSQPEVRATPTAALVPRIAAVDAAGALSSMNVDGGSIVTYPAPGVTFQFPAWSPDGTRIAAIGTDDRGAGVYVFAAPGGGSVATAPTIAYKSADHPAFYLYWDPNGKALAFLTTEPGGIALRYVAADASAPDSTVRTGSPMYWQWVDPTRLLVHSGGNAPGAFVGEVGPDGAVTAPIAIEPGLFRPPGVSGGGGYLAYSTPGQGDSASVVVDSRDGATHREVSVFGGAALEFDPVGDALAFVAPDQAGATPDLPIGPLRAVDPASGVVRTLLGGSVVAFFWAPDGRTIAALRLGAPGDTNVAARSDAVASLARAGVPPDAAQTAAGVQLRIVFVDVASGSIRSERTGRLSDLFISQVLPFFDQYALSHRVWSPDGTSILLPLDDDQGVSQLTIIPADGSPVRQLAPGVIGFWSP